MRKEDTVQPMQGQPTTIKRAILIAVLTGVVMAIMNSVIQRYTNTSYATFGSVECKRLWIVDDDGKTRILLSVGDDGAFMTLSDWDADDTKSWKTAGLSIEKSGGKLYLSGREGAVIVKPGDGIRIYDKDGNVAGSLPQHAQPNTKKNR